jgi:NADH-quinone oxidoreductase subunit L
VGFLIPAILTITVALTAYYMGRQLLMVFFNDSRRPFATQPHDGTLLQKLPIAILALFSTAFFYSFNPLSIEGSWLVSFLANNSLLTQTNEAVESTSNGLSLTAIVLSLVSVLIGLGLSWLYFGKKSVNNNAPTSNQSWGYGLSANNFYLDSIYNRILVVPYQSFAQILALFDRVVIDGLINFMGIATVVLSKIAALVDQYVIDGIVVSLGRVSKFLGQITRNIQGGNAQSYYFWALASAVIILFWLFQLIEWKITF